MQRRRKRNRGGATQTKKTNSTNVKLDKSLPSLPPPDDSDKLQSDEIIPEADFEPPAEVASRKPAGPRPQPGSEVANTEGLSPLIS